MSGQDSVGCTCPREGFDAACVWARDGIGHVKHCPVSGDPCPCLSDSIAEAHCTIQARDLLAGRSTHTKEETG